MSNPQVTAPRTPAEREAMVEAEYQPLRARKEFHALADFPVEWCTACWKRADASIPPVSPAPALDLVTADEYGKRIGAPQTTTGERLLATLRHYEAEVGRLEGLGPCNASSSPMCTGSEGTTPSVCWECWQAERDMRVGADELIASLESQLAREAPFAALGRYEADETRSGIRERSALLNAARAALAEEREPEWSRAPSGCRYQMRDGKLWRQIEGGEEYVVVLVSLPDIAFVAKLMESKGVTP